MHWAGQLSRWLFTKRSLIGIALILTGVLYSIFGAASGAQLGHRSLTLSNNEAGGTTSFRLGFTTVTSGNLGSIVVQFCSNDPFPSDPCIAPNGFDVSQVTLSNQTGVSGFTIDTTATTANLLQLTRNPAFLPPTPVSFDIDGAINPNTAGSYYARILTYATANASGASSDYGGLAFAILDKLQVSAEVPPYLIFCSAVVIGNFNCANSSGTAIDFGELSAKQANTGSSQLLAATNALNGYNITMGGITMTSGTNIIAPLASNDVSRPGTAQFGINLVANSTPFVGSDPSGTGAGAPSSQYAQANFYRFVSGEIIAANPTADNLREYTVSYVVNVPVTQAPGIYDTTITYVCLATF